MNEKKERRGRRKKFSLSTTDCNNNKNLRGAWKSVFIWMNRSFLNSTWLEMLEKWERRREKKKELDGRTREMKEREKNEEKDEEIFAVIILIIISYRYYVRKRVSFFFFSPSPSSSLSLPSLLPFKLKRSPREKKEIEEKDFWTSESWKVEYQWRVMMWFKVRKRRKKKKEREEERWKVLEANQPTS